MDSVSYSAGLIIAKNLKSQGFTDLDKASFLEALDDVYSGKTLKITLDEANTNFRNHVQGAKSRMDEVNKVEGEKFLAENSKKPNITTTASGLQYEVLEQGNSGRKPSATDKVKVHYHGTLTDGTVFDSSVDRGEPISFPLNGVIKGWTEGVQLMEVGSKYRFYIPHDLAYGSRGAGASIKPFSALIFDVALLDIE
ncbi:FKBP-type peptidyl-prolyl cis-trans isomerase [Saprospiraceae bacterium]|nr:FKBP-type peptidyl-prolyl cis-trans isomerase [Saprospiraceae bacterium]